MGEIYPHTQKPCVLKHFSIQTIISNDGMSYQILTSSGVCVKKGILTKEETRINIADLASGAYWVSLNNKKGYGSQLLLIE